MFIDNTNGIVNSTEIVYDEEIIATVFEIEPTVVFTPLLRYDYFNYINTIPERCNNIILNGIIHNFEHIINKYFIEVVEDASFDYEYGDICSTHNCVTGVGYVKRTPDTEAIAQEEWDYY